MRYFLSIIILAVLFGNCNNKNEESRSPGAGTDQPDKQDPVITDVSGCYRRIIARDTFTAVFEQKGSVVNGRLVFDNYEKDSSSGDVKGKVEGDTIKLIYTFNSE